MFVVHVHDLASHPVACCEPGPPRQRMAGRLELSLPRSVLLAPGCPRTPHAKRRTRKMRLTDFCNRPASRAPCRLPDSRVRDRSRRPALGQWPRTRPQVKLRLTANLQLRHGRNPPRPRAVSLLMVSFRRGASVMPRGPGGASIDGSSALHLPTAALSTASRACDVASDALCRDPIRARPCLSAGPNPEETTRHRFHRRLVKDDCFVDTRTPSLDECSLLCGAARPLELAGLVAFATSGAPAGFRRWPHPKRRIIDSPPPCPRFCHREPASSTLSPAEHVAGRLDPTLARPVARPCDG
jgi:hypothetical protein